VSFRTVTESSFVCFVYLLTAVYYGLHCVIIAFGGDLFLYLICIIWCIFLEVRKATYVLEIKSCKQHKNQSATVKNSGSHYKLECGPILECGPMPNVMAALRNIGGATGCPLLNTAKFGSRPLLECRAVTLKYRTQDLDASEFCTW